MTMLERAKRPRVGDRYIKGGKVIVVSGVGEKEVRTVCLESVSMDEWGKLVSECMKNGTVEFKPEDGK
jgi:hypothetical protein